MTTKRIGAASALSMLGSSVLLCCVHAAVGKEKEVVVGDLTVVASSRANGAFVVDALADANARLARFDLRLLRPSRVLVHDDVHDFVMATKQTTPSLRAWSTFQTIHLLPPSTWTDPSSTSSRLAHELCHLSVWQRVGESNAKAIPRFVTEGVCSVVADQGAARMPRQQVKDASDAGAAVNFDDDAAYAYGYAHAVVAAFVACGGVVSALVDATAAGVAVEDALGAAPRAFLDVDVAHPDCSQVGGKR